MKSTESWFDNNYGNKGIENYYNSDRMWERCFIYPGFHDGYVHINRINNFISLRPEHSDFGKMFVLKIKKKKSEIESTFSTFHKLNEYTICISDS